MITSLPQSQPSDQSIVVYQPNSDLSIPFRREDGETYGTQKEMSLLFSVTTPSVSEHIKNFSKADPDTYSRSVRKFRILTEDGKWRDIEHYNIDVITYVGYRVQATPQTVAFRRWVAGLVKQEAAKATLNPIQLFRQMVDAYEHQQRQIEEVSNKLGTLTEIVEDKQYFTIAQYCQINTIKVGTSIHQKWGNDAGDLSRAEGIPIRKIKVYGKRWDAENAYHEDILVRICIAKQASLNGQAKLPLPDEDDDDE